MLERNLKRYVLLSIMMVFLQSVLVILIPFVSINGTVIQRIMAYIIAFLFWTSIIFQVVLVSCISYKRKRAERRLYKNKKMKLSLPGIVSFFQNKEAMAADIVLFISIVFLGIIIWMQVKTSWMIIGVVSILILSFGLHCILNGKNYRCLKELKNNVKEQREDE